MPEKYSHNEEACSDLYNRLKSNSIYSLTCDTVLEESPLNSNSISLSNRLSQLSHINIFFIEKSVIMRMISINFILCLLIVLIGIAVSSSSSTDNDESAPPADWNYFDAYYPYHLLKARAAKSRFWKRAPHRKFWKRSLSELAMNNDDMTEFQYGQDQQQEKH
ncbi:unnamed protein product [Rotaria magnacalcarata]|uniref:Uncharacterized protein n=1 Tax=Rotaria magnacalcarata TaxID=392030 RepID=A0A816XWP9_9BILA|nr:unnamed protein product [Rotaria magnacalcarata]